ncbi:MAG: hypothetical protein HWD58_11495 [Bacteroidota bacterium]|nr:MAG: hypothetical protein HWD58_11495 [Bacteroidota bacterium]
MEKGELRHFLKARIEKEGVRILDGQESYKLNSFMDANGLVTLQEQHAEMNPGDLVDCLPFNASGMARMKDEYLNRFQSRN